MRLKKPRKGLKRGASSREPSGGTPGNADVGLGYKEEDKFLIDDFVKHDTKARAIVAGQISMKEQVVIELAERRPYFAS